MEMLATEGRPTLLPCQHGDHLACGLATSTPSGLVRGCMDGTRSSHTKWTGLKGPSNRRSKKPTKTQERLPVQLRAPDWKSSSISTTRSWVLRLPTAVTTQTLTICQQSSCSTALTDMTRKVSMSSGHNTSRDLERFIPHEISRARHIIVLTDWHVCNYPQINKIRTINKHDLAAP